jgi:hypothetical protein
VPEATARLISLARLARRWARRALLKKRMNNGLSYSVYAPTLDSTNRHGSAIPFKSFRFDTTRYLRTFSSDLRQYQTRAHHLKHAGYSLGLKVASVDVAIGQRNNFNSTRVWQTHWDPPIRLQGSPGSMLFSATFTRGASVRVVVNPDAGGNEL